MSSGYPTDLPLKTITVNGRTCQYYVRITRGNDQKALENFQRVLGRLADEVERKIAAEKAEEERKNNAGKQTGVRP